MQPLLHQGRAVVSQQGRLDDAQVRQQLLGAQVRVLRRHGVARGVAAGEFLERRRQARVHAGERAPVRLVQPVFVGVGRAVRQLAHSRRDPDQHRRQRQLRAQVMDLGEVVAQRHFALAPQRVFQRVRADVGIAVAVAADPLAHAQEAGHRMLAQLALQVGVDLGNLAQEGGLVIAQRVLDLVGHRQLGETQQPGLPQLQHAGADLRLVGRQLARRQRVLGQARAP